LPDLRPNAAAEETPPYPTQSATPPSGNIVANAHKNGCLFMGSVNGFSFYASGCIIHERVCGACPMPATCVEDEGEC